MKAKNLQKNPVCLMLITGPFFVASPCHGLFFDSNFNFLLNVFAFFQLCWTKARRKISVSTSSCIVSIPSCPVRDGATKTCRLLAGRFVDHSLALAPVSQNKSIRSIPNRHLPINLLRRLYAIRNACCLFRSRRAVTQSLQ